jgi:hypothetical protein
MIDYINEQADFFECFLDNPKVGRATRNLKVNRLLSMQYKKSKQQIPVTKNLHDNSKQTMDLLKNKGEFGIRKSATEIGQLSTSSLFDRLFVCAFLVSLTLAIILPNISYS